MKSVMDRSKTLRLSAVVAGLLIFFGALSTPSGKAQNIIGQILTQMDEYNKSLQSLQSEITMVKTDAGLGVSDATYGKTSYLPKSGKRVMYVRIDWTKPVEESMVVIGDDYKLYRPKLNMVYEGKTGKAKNSASAGGALAFLSMSKDQLKANYTINYIGDEDLKDGTRTWHLQLTPKVATTYKLADIWVNRSRLPQQAKVTETNNDTTTILLKNIQSNVKIEATVFALKWPSGTVVKKV